MIELAGVIVAVLGGLVAMFKYLFDYLDKRIDSFVLSLEARISARLIGVVSDQHHCKELCMYRLTELENKLTSIELYMHKSTVLDYIIKDKNG